MLLSRAHLLATLAVLVVLSVGCNRGKGDLDGIGPFRLGHTTPDDKAVGRCTERDDFMYCSNNSGVSLAGQVGEVHLYMKKLAGQEKPTATEIMVVVRRCEIDAVEAALRKELGEAATQVGGRLVWVSKSASIIAQLPAEGTTCEINFLHPSETKRIAELTPATTRPEKAP